MKHLIIFHIKNFRLRSGSGTHVHPYYIIRYGPRDNQLAKSYKNIVVLFNNNLDAATKKKVEMFVEHLKNGILILNRLRLITPVMTTQKRSMRPSSHLVQMLRNVSL